MYTVRFGTGAGDYTSGLPLDELMQQVAGDATYTQQDVKIEDAAGETVARLPWYGTKAGDTDAVTVDFGDFGFYGAWIL
jgi:hypothetical protein